MEGGFAATSAVVSITKRSVKQGFKVLQEAPQEAPQLASIAAELPGYETT